MMGDTAHEANTQPFHALLDCRASINTAHGVRVIETSTDPYVARVIQGPADVVDSFTANGRPARPSSERVGRQFETVYSYAKQGNGYRSTR